MLNKREITKISIGNGINCDNHERVGKLIDISEYATNDYKELSSKKHLKEHFNGDLSSLVDALIMLCKKEVRDAKDATKNTLNLNDVVYSDDKNLYLNGNYGTVSVSKAAYVDARIRNGIKYGVNLLGGATLLGIAKILKKTKK